MDGEQAEDVFGTRSHPFLWFFLCQRRADQKRVAHQRGAEVREEDGVVLRPPNQRGGKDITAAPKALARETTFFS